MDDADALAGLRDALGDGTAQPLRLFLALWRSRGRTLAYTQIADRLRDLSGEYPDMWAIRSALKRIRPLLRAADWPVEIKTARGIGLRLVVTRPGWTWTIEEDV